MTPYKELFGLESTTFTDQQIMEIMEKARRQQKFTVEFPSGKRKINVLISPVSEDGIMNEDWGMT
jgi:predicted DNA binding CopG/RHH family protein